MKNMLGNFQVDMVIFTDKQNKPIIEKIRFDNNLQDKTTIVEREFKELLMYSKMNVWKEHLKIDPEKNIHNENLYIIWNEKFNFVKEAKMIINNTHEVEWYAWFDIGCFRNRGPNAPYFDLTLNEIKTLPSYTKIDLLPLKLVFILTGIFTKIEIEKLDKLDADFTKTNRISGSSFMIPSNQVNEWCSRYYDVLERYIIKNKFAGKDQSIMATMFLENIQNINLLHTNNNNPSDPWFYLQKYLI
jgi:hypothetical protein